MQEENNQQQQTRQQIQQLKDKITGSLRTLTEDEISKWVEFKDENHLEENAIFLFFNLKDGKKAPGERYFDYKWNEDFYEKMKMGASKRKFGEIDITKKTNETAELEKRIESLHENTENEIERLTKETQEKIEELNKTKETKIKEMIDKIENNKEMSTSLEKTNAEIEENILKLSGRNWKNWL